MAVVVNDDHVDGVQESFTAACRRGEDEVFIEPDGEVARGARGVAEAMNPTAETGELATQVHFGEVEG